jgi:hypothetical protein
MSNSDSLTKQLQSAEAGSRELDREIWKRFEPEDYNKSFWSMKAVCPKGSSDDYVEAQMATHKRYTTSIDAALALVKEVLPGWTWDCREQDDKSHYVTLQRGYRTSYDKVVGGRHKSPAIALCLALLSAAAVEDTK